MGRAGARARDGSRAEAHSSGPGAAKRDLWVSWSSLVPWHGGTLPSPEAVGLMPKQTLDGGDPGDPPRGAGGVEETHGIRNGSSATLACPQAGQLSPGTAYQAWRNVKWQNHSPGGLHRLHHLPALQGPCEPVWEWAWQGLRSHSPSRTLRCLRKAGPAVSDDGVSHPHPVLGARLPRRSLAGSLASRAPCSGDSPPRQDWIMITLGLPSSAWQCLLLNFS